MAACASLSIADEALCATDKKANFQRLARLLMCGGVTLLREVFDSIHPPANLPVKLNDPATKTQLKGAKLTKPEWDCVYPSPGMCGKSTDFDITLLFRLLRTICCLTPPATGWDKLPINADHSCEADLARIKYYRNSVHSHKHTMEITDSDFANLWREISEALLRIAGTISTAKRDEWKESINKLFHDPLTPDAGRYVAELQSWYKKDIDTKDEVEKWGNTIMEQLINDKQEQITMNDKQHEEQITMLNAILQKLTCKQNQQINIINIYTTIESNKPGGSSITQIQFPNTPVVQQPGLQSESACIGPTGIPPEQPQTEGAVGTSSSLDIWQVILSSCNLPLLFEKLRMMFDVDVQSSRLGSLVITVSCSSLEVLEGLWKGHCTGHLNEMVQETLVTAEVLQELCLSEVKLKTIISEKEYNACKELFTQGNENLQQLTRERSPSATTTSTSDDSDEKEIQEATSQGAVVVPTSLDNRPVSDTELHDIGSGLGTSWKELGRCLGIPEKDLKAIDMKGEEEKKGILMHMWNEMWGGISLRFPEKHLKAIDLKEHDIEERKGISMLNMWKETWGEYATWVVLQGALEEIGRTDLSQKGETKTKMPHRPAAAIAAEPAAYADESLQFKEHLMSISNQLTSDDLNKMKFYLQGDLPKRKLEEVQLPYQLFSVMMEAKLLSATNLTRLVELLEVVGRVDLSKYLLMLLEVEGETKTKMPHRPAAAIAAEPAAYGETKTKMPHRPEVATAAEFPTGIFADESLHFKEHLMAISNQLTSNDLNKMKFFLQDDLPKRKLEEVQLPYQLFSLMMEAKLLSANNLTRLAELLEVVGRVDLSKYVLLEVEGETKTKMPHRPAAAMAAEPAAYEQTYVKHSEIPKGENYIAESGYVMVISNYIYPSSNLPPRTEEKEAMREFHVTLKYLKDVFQFIFGFRLEQHENLTKSEMLKELTHTAEKDFSTHDCFVCVIQCEGSKDGIFGTDDEVIKPETITSLFSRDKCPSLDGKPKIFLIQALQRQQTYKGPGSGPPPRPVIFQDDFLIWYAPCIQHPFSFFGSPLGSLTYTLSGRDTSSRDLMEILMGVNEEAGYLFPFRPPYLVSTLTKKVLLKNK